MIIYYIGDSKGNSEWFFCKEENYQSKLDEIRKQLVADPTFVEDWSEDGDFMETDSRMVLFKEIETSDDL